MPRDQIELQRHLADTPADELLCIVVRPLIWPIWRSMGAVTSVDIVSAPGAGVERGDDDRGEIDLGQGGDGECVVAERAAEQDGDGEQAGGDGAGDEGGADGHCGPKGKRNREELGGMSHSPQTPRLSFRLGFIMPQLGQAAKACWLTIP